MATVSHSAPSGKRSPLTRIGLLAAVVAGRVDVEVADRWLEVYALLQRRGVEPTYYGVLHGVAGGVCSQHAADRFLAADRAVRRNLRASAA